MAQHNLGGYSFENAIDYHYNAFPPKHLDYARLIGPVTEATNAVARYDQMLQSLHNSEILINPLRGQEAVISSQMEGTISTLDEILRIEADTEEAEATFQNARSEAIETFLYSRALRQAEAMLEDRYQISETLIRQTHKTLLSFGRGAFKSPGAYKSEQNYIGDDARREITFIPIAPVQLPPAMETLIDFINNPNQLPLLATALAHIEFEALHPFKDGNGRLGRMLITLMMWQNGLVARPHFYISGYLEEAKAEYIERMRKVSAEGDWSGWCEFFLVAVKEQAERNLRKSKEINDLYEDMKPIFRDMLSSQWVVNAQDFLFKHPVFRNNRFTNRSGIPKQTAARFTRALYERGILIEVEPASGRQAALYSFEPLLEMVRV